MKTIALWSAKKKEKEKEPLRASVPQLDLNLHSNPYDDKLISVFLEGGKRTLSKPIIKKDPITPDILSKIIDIYGKDHSNLKNVRLCAMLLLGRNGNGSLYQTVQINRDGRCRCR
jgi:hypothetical protein